MNPFSYLVPLLLFAVTGTAALYLLQRLKRDRELVALMGLFCMALGIFLLALDLVLITFTHGPEHIPAYLVFNRLVSDTGFAGRWVLTVYLFIAAGVGISFYLLVRNQFRKFNAKNGRNP